MARRLSGAWESINEVEWGNILGMMVMGIVLGGWTLIVFLYAWVIETEGAASGASAIARFGYSFSHRAAEILLVVMLVAVAFVAAMAVLTALINLIVYGWHDTSAGRADQARRLLPRDPPGPPRVSGGYDANMNGPFG